MALATATIPVFSRHDRARVLLLALLMCARMRADVFTFVSLDFTAVAHKHILLRIYLSVVYLQTVDSSTKEKNRYQTLGQTRSLSSSRCIKFRIYTAAVSYLVLRARAAENLSGRCAVYISNTHIGNHVLQ